MEKQTLNILVSLKNSSTCVTMVFGCMMYLHPSKPLFGSRLCRRKKRVHWTTRLPAGEKKPERRRIEERFGWKFEGSLDPAQ